MADLVDYTALESATWKEGFPICASTPVDGVDREFIRKVRVNFGSTGTGLAAADWATVINIPAHTYVFSVSSNIIVAEAADAAIIVGTGDANAGWIAAQTGQVIDVMHSTKSTDANYAGVYFHTAGVITISATSALDTLVIDLYVHCMTIDPA